MCLQRNPIAPSPATYVASNRSDKLHVSLSFSLYSLCPLLRGTGPSRLGGPFTGGPAQSFIVGPHSQHEHHKICRIFFGNCKYIGPTNIKRPNPPRRCALEFEKSPSPSPLYHLEFFVFSFLLKICDFQQHHKVIL